MGRAGYRVDAQVLPTRGTIDVRFLVKDVSKMELVIFDVLEWIRLLSTISRLFG